MNDLEKVKSWLEEFPGFDRLEEFRVDFADDAGENGGLFPGGLQELARRQDIFGNVRVRNRYLFRLYFVLRRAPEDGDTGTRNAAWLLELQNWVQERSTAGTVPGFGSRTLGIRAGRGTLHTATPEGNVVYSADLSVEFEREMRGAPVF